MFGYRKVYVKKFRDLNEATEYILRARWPLRDKKWWFESDYIYAGWFDHEYHRLKVYKNGLVKVYFCTEREYGPCRMSCLPDEVFRSREHSEEDLELRREAQRSIDHTGYRIHRECFEYSLQDWSGGIDKITEVKGAAFDKKSIISAVAWAIQHPKNVKVAT